MKLDDKTVKLVGLGASIAANCQPCTEYHLKVARDYGITNEEIDEVISIAYIVKKNASKFLADFAKKLLSGETIPKEREKGSEPICCPGSPKSDRNSVSGSDTTCCGT